MNKATQEVLFSSKTGDWSTPQAFYDRLNWRFGPFTLDPAATADNTKCAKFYTKEENGLHNPASDFSLGTMHGWETSPQQARQKGYLGTTEQQ